MGIAGAGKALLWPERCLLCGRVVAAGEDCFWLPEDLCFFSQGKLWLGTSSHEYHASAYPRSRNEAEALLALAPWQEKGEASPLWTPPLELADFSLVR